MYKKNISFKIILNNRFLVFQTQGLYCHDLIFCKWVNLQNPDIGMKVRMRLTGKQCRKGLLEWGTSINTSCTTYKRRALQGNIFMFLLQGVFLSNLFS